MVLETPEVSGKFDYKAGAEMLLAVSRESVTNL